MEFRTPIGKINSEFGISHSDKILMLGSCFTDSIGERLERGGFDVVRNPGGPLFNPASIAGAIAHADTAYTARDLVEHDGIYHCLDFASRFSGKDAEEVLDRVNAVRETIADRLACADRQSSLSGPRAYTNTDVRSPATAIVFRRPPSANATWQLTK